MYRLDFYDLFLIFGVIIQYVQANTITCQVDDVSVINGPCGEFESCFQLQPVSTEGVCKCRAGYERSPVNNTCMYVNQAPKSTATESAIIIINDSTNKTAIVFVSLLVILIVLGLVGAVYYGQKQYRIISRIRSRLARQHVSSYDEVMIGQDDDDPPIA